MNRRWTPPQRRFFFLLLFVFLLLAGGIAALGYGNYRSAQDRLRAQTKDQLAAIAALKAGELEKWKNERLADAAFFYQNREFSRRVENYLKTPAEENTESLLAWLEKTAYSSEYRRAALLDAQGRERLSVPSSSESLSPEMTLQVSKILEAGNLTFLDFHTHSDSTEIYLSVAIPLFSAEKQPLGVLLLQIDPNQYIYPYLQRWPLPSESGETLLVRREGNEVVFLNQLRFKKDAALNLRIPLQREQVVAVKAALGTEGFTEGVDYRGTPVLAEIRAIPNSPWLLIAKMDKSEVYAPLRGRLRQDVVFSALLTLTSAAALALIWRKQEADRYRAQIETLHALRASEKKFRVAFDTNPDAVSISRLRDGVFVSVNKGFEKISGYAREEILGKTAVELNLWKDPQERNKFIEQLLAKGRVQNYEADFCARSGEIQGLVSAALMELDGEPHLLNIVHDISNRKRAEETLRQAEEKYPSIFENAVEGIFQSLPDGRFINVNPAFARMLGYESPAELLENITDIAAQTYVDKERRVELMRLIEEQGVVAGFEFRMKRRDGSEIWVRENARAVCDAAGNLLYYEGFAEDITERKKAEQALAESEQKLRALVEQTPAIVYTESAETRETLFISPQVEKVTGYSAADWMAERDLWKSMIHPEDLPAVLEADERTRQTCEPYQAEYRILTKDGRVRWLHDEAVLIQNNEEGAPLFWQGVMYDITERREAEEHIRRLSRIVEQSPASIVITNRLGYIEYANPAFSELTGYSLEEAKDKTPRILKSGYTSESEYKKLWNVITSGHIWRGEFLNKKKNGETYWESAIIAPVFNDAGKIINFVGVKQDITERKRAEEERESARRFLQNVQDSLAAHIAILDGLGNIVQVNAAWKEFGRKNGLTHPDACVGMNYLEVCDKAAQTGEEGAAEAAAAIRQALNGERESAWFEYPCHAPNEKRWYTARISSFYNHGQRWAVVSHENITARKQAEESLRARAAELELLYESGLTLAQSLDQRQICRRLIKLLSEKLNWHHTAIRLLNSEEQTFELVAFDLPNKGKSPQGETTLLKNLRLDEGLSGWAFQQARPIRVGDVSQDPHYIESYPGIRSGLYVPLKLGDRSLGVISVESETLNAFSEADERFIVTAANQAAALLENARLYKEVRSQAKELEKRVRERTAEIESTRRRLELALKTAGIGIWEWDVSSEVESWDDKVFELHGLDKEKDQPSHAAWRKTVHPDDLPLQMERIEKALLGKRPYNSEYRVILPGGAIRHLKVNGIVIRDKEGKPQRVIGADQDITLHKQAEESLLRANAEMQRSLRMKTEFLATMSHELRTPLNSILGISESLEEQIAGPLNEKQLKYIRTVSESGRHLLELINDILDLSRIEAGKLDLDIQSVSVQKVCAASLRMIKELAQKKSLNVSFKMDENAQTVRGDERRLKQILVNLLGNAVKFTPEGGDIGLEVKTNLQAHEILFTVWDKGIGIAEEDRERLFQPFVQLKSGLAREYGGSGLGLALVMQMTHLHGGKVSVESKVNEGSRFTVALPWEAEEKAKNLPLAVHEIPQRNSGGIVLIVEDTEVVAHLISDYLRHKGYRTFIAANGREGVLLAKEKRPHLILMDVMMPVMNGLEAAKAIRADPSLRNTPIIGLTALAMPSDREECIKAGMNDHVAKPVQMQELLKIIERFLRRED